ATGGGGGGRTMNSGGGGGMKITDPFPHRQIRLVSEPDRVVSDVSCVAVANLRSLSVYAGQAKDRRSHQFRRPFRRGLAPPHSISSSAISRKSRRRLQRCRPSASCAGIHLPSISLVNPASARSGTDRGRNVADQLKRIGFKSAPS